MKSAFSIFFALLLLTSHVSLSFATHYCGGEAFATSINILGNKSPGCSMQGEGMEDCTNESGIQNKSCCEDDAATLQIKDQYTSNSSVALSNSLVFLSSFISTYIYLNQHTDSFTFDTDHYDPPVLELDIPVLIQSFLI